MFNFNGAEETVLQVLFEKSRKNVKVSAPIEVRRRAELTSRNQVRLSHFCPIPLGSVWLNTREQWMDKQTKSPLKAPRRPFRLFLTLIGHRVHCTVLTFVWSFLDKRKWEIVKQTRFKKVWKRKKSDETEKVLKKRRKNVKRAWRVKNTDGGSDVKIVSAGSECG